MFGPRRNIVVISAAAKETQASVFPDANSKFLSSFHLCYIYIVSRVYKKPNTENVLLAACNELNFCQFYFLFCHTIQLTLTNYGYQC